jgi:hypothetical protein
MIQKASLNQQANAVGLVSSKIESDLKRFKEFIEKRGHGCMARNYP